ncbi:MAG TPA: regulatory iron-sulfur-containing complex subunit RicT [Deltaproteobacteria bacterium]|nr:regulatory iron-sulfur-containing complex subunit RicT [Deltaproteobacteria bacterium]HPR56540.1 regulatory iron-sulfur-containing complex subunit RicT [Deltaproteobacteria bacterium]HXK47965.1 regulatory iron-sulfur-containing complex subunit RicT [Deltaproteobacteria bacterium]
MRFESIPTPYIFDAQDLELRQGDRVIVGTEAGQCAAMVIGYPREEEAAGLEDIKPVVRKVTEEDEARLDRIHAKEKDCYAFCHERIRARGLSMKLIRVEQLFDENKITFYFVAEGRVDFRELLKDLVERYRTRIELRQVGTRQESAMLGGIGSCGRELCCATFLTNFQRISVKMAKNQNMTLNPTKISGLCGKLKCCLAYEKESYANLIENLPKPGKKVFLAEGEAMVVSINVINQTVVAKLTDRRFVKAHVSDILSEEEYQQLPEQKGPPQDRGKPAPTEERPEDELPMVPMIATSPKPKKKRSRSRNARKKRSKRP